MRHALNLARRRVGAWIGGFEGGLSGRRLKSFQTSRAHVNTLIAASGGDLTARARYLIRNNGYAANAIESWAGNVAGSGITPSSRIADAATKARVQQLWLESTDAADADGLTDFYGLQRRAAREVFIAGEVFFRFRPRRLEDGLPVPLQLQMLPSELLPLAKTELGGSTIIRQGIEFDRIGRRVAYHFLRRHPGDVTDPGLVGETVRIPSAEIVHVIDPVDAGQLRGVSRFAAAIVKLFLLDQYDDAELDRKKTAAQLAMLWITTAPPEAPPAFGQKTDGADDRVVELQPGTVVPLAPGEDIKPTAPADVGDTYEPFQYRTLLQVSAALGIPYAYLSNDMIKANYSNARLALLEFRRRTEAWQHAVLVWQLCRQVWARWMDTAVLADALTLPGYERRRREYLACSWLPPKWDWVDPQKDARAEIEQIAAGLKSRSQALAERGYDAEQVDAEIAADRAREAALGLDFTLAGGGSAEQENGGEATP